MGIPAIGRACQTSGTNLSDNITYMQIIFSRVIGDSLGDIRICYLEGLLLCDWWTPIIFVTCPSIRSQDNQCNFYSHFRVECENKKYLVVIKKYPTLTPKIPCVLLPNFAIFDILEDSISQKIKV
jgi:hypothetical protein